MKEITAIKTLLSKVDFAKIMTVASLLHLTLQSVYFSMLRYASASVYCLVKETERTITMRL